MWAPSWGEIRPFWGYVEAMWAHLEPCWFLNWACLGELALKTLSPVACEVPCPFAPQSFSRKPWSCLGRTSQRRCAERSPQWPARFQETLPEGGKRRSAAPGGFPVAEAKVQATTSLTLHGMAGFKGLTPKSGPGRIYVCTLLYIYIYMFFSFIFIRTYIYIDI